MQQFLTETPLFRAIAPEDIPRALACLEARQEDFPKGAYILTAGQEAHRAGIIAAGRAHVIQEDFWGNRTIIAQVGPQEMFGEAFACAHVAHLPVSVVAAAQTRVLFINCGRIAQPCGAACAFHAQLVANMLGILAGKNVLLTGKMTHLARRSTREKLLSYLSAEAVKAGSARFCIPFDRQELADYLLVERSALSRTLGQLQKEGMLTYKKNAFVLNEDADR
nr:Crp/Fnr family transcriptional regulator [Maliibacterium massiliense]